MTDVKETSWDTGMWGSTEYYAKVETTKRCKLTDLELIWKEKMRWLVNKLEAESK